MEYSSRLYIQIQHLLKLNVAKSPEFKALINNSNTTLVKVKSLSYLKIKLVFGYSNTTLVKVK